MVRAIATGLTRAYHLTEGLSLKQWLGKVKNPKSKETVKKSRVNTDIIQEFEFNQVAEKIIVSEDGEIVAAVGGHPPTLQTWKVSNLAPWYARGIDYDAVDVMFLNRDGSKIVTLGAGREIEFHTSAGGFFKMRTPKACRTMGYFAPTAELFLSGSTNEVYRLDLEEGEWLAPLETGLEQINVLKINPTLPLIAIAGFGKQVEVWDIENPEEGPKTLIAWQDGDDDENGVQITSMDFSANGLRLVVGFSSGLVRLYDIRSQTPIAEKDLMNGNPIVDMKIVRKMDSQGKNVIGAGALSGEIIIVADLYSIKVLEEKLDDEAKSKLVTLATLASNFKLTSIALYPLSGLIMASGDSSRLQMYYVPLLGLAPRFVDYLESLTAEVDPEEEVSFFDDHKFVTRHDLLNLNAEHYIGTDFATAHMHGYFIPADLYHEMKERSKPAILAAMQSKKLQKAIQKEEEKQRPVFKKSVKTNKEILRNIRRMDAEDEEAVKEHALTKDERFADMFND